MAHASAHPSANVGRWGDFFRYHGFWSPGVRRFRNLRFRTKALIVSVVLLMPALVLGLAFVEDTR